MVVRWFTVFQLGSVHFIFSKKVTSVGLKCILKLRVFWGNFWTSYGLNADQVVLHPGLNSSV